MFEALRSLDTMLFRFLNQTVSNPVFDIIMPLITDWNRSFYGLGLFAVLWSLLMWKGGRKGRIVGLLLIPLIVASDKLSSAVIKEIVARPRPCHTVGGMQVVEHIRQLVDCGSGYSFPSTHAVIGFSVAVFMSYYFRRWRWVFFAYAIMISLSRVVVGVHYPFDIIAGAIIGCIFAGLLILLWKRVERVYPSIAISPPPSGAPPLRG